MFDITPVYDLIGQGYNWIWAALIGLIVLEIFYLLLIRQNVRRRNDSLLSHTLGFKSTALAFTILFGLMIGITTIFLVELAIVAAVGGGITLYIYLNYLATKKLGKQETEEEFRKRVGKNSNFGIGDKVRLKKSFAVYRKTKDDYGDWQNEEIEYDSNCSSSNGVTHRYLNATKKMESYKGKVLTISDFDDDGDLRIKEDKGKNIWCDEMFNLVRKAEKGGRKK